MANEFKHVSVGTSMSQAEYESTAGHVFNSQAQGDIMVATSSSQLSRLAVGATAGMVLRSDATDPSWSLLDGTSAADAADKNTAGALAQIFRVKTAGGATATISVTLGHKIRVIDAWCVNAAAGTTSDTVTIKNNTTAISDAMDISGADKTIKHAATLDDAQWEVASAGTLAVTETDGGGSDSPACDVFVLAIKVA